MEITNFAFLKMFLFPNLVINYNFILPNWYSDLSTDSSDLYFLIFSPK